MSSFHILIVDDDPHLREVLRYALARDGHSVTEAADGREALGSFDHCLVSGDPIDLVVLDVLMPEMDGLEVCRKLRGRGSVPVLFLSSRGEELDRVLGLELGGDDYVTKPFSVRELCSRVKALLRRAYPEAPSNGATAPDPALRAGTLCLDPASHRVSVGSAEVELTVTEFRILGALMSRPGRVYTREDLGEQAYDGPHFVADRTLDSHIRRIRQKLRDVGADPIETVHGLGFRLRTL